MPPRLRSPFAALARLSCLLAAGPLANAPAIAQEPPPYVVRQLTPSGDPASRVGSLWAADPRGDWIAFAGDVELAGAEAVYAVRRNGSDLHRLSPYGAVSTIRSVAFSPDGRRVIFLGDLEVNGLDEIWSVPPWGSPAAAVKLNIPVSGAGVSAFRVPSTSDRIVYGAETSGGSNQIWSVPAAGPSGAGVRLDPPPQGDEQPSGIEISSDGLQIVVQMIDTTALTTRLLAVPILGPASAAVLLADTEPGGCPAAVTDFTPDGARVVYARLCFDGANYLFTQLWSVPADGPATAAISLAGSFVTGGEIKSLQLSPDGSRLVFVADKLIDERFEIWSVPTAGPAAALVRLNPTLVTNGDVLTNFHISPDSSRVAYIADQVSDERYFPYSVPIDGPSSSVVSLYQGILAVSADVQDLDFTPDSSGVVFRFDLAVDERFDLYWAPADGSTPQVRITNRGSNPAPARSVSSPWYVHPDGERVFYTFDEAAPGDRRGLGEQRIVGPYSADARWNAPPVAGGQVMWFSFLPDDQGLLYRSDQTQNEKFELFTVDLRLLDDGFESGDTGAWPDLP